MHDDRTTHQDRLRRHAQKDGLSGILHGKEGPPEAEPGEESCAAFGYLRGIRERADALELRLREGNSVWFPYNWLGTWKYNPSEGLLLKFSGDLVYLVLIRGSNLDKPLADTTTNLTTSGLARHRIVWMREMNQQEIEQVGDSGPTIDSILIGEFESHEALKEWLGKNAPALLT